ncbi:MAG: solute carrier family 23 protein, partial [Paucilactobacillus nenjiangensis]
ILGGLFNTFPYSTFSQNVGVLKLSGVKTRKPVYFAAFFLIVLGLLPKIGALATIIPSAVLGGAMVVMFGMVGVQGMQILHKVDFSKSSNLLIASMSIGLGIGVNTYPQIFQHLGTELQIMLSNGVVVGSVTAVVLNLILNRKGLKDQEF